MKRSEKFFLEGYNCAQSVFCAYVEEFGISKDTALKLSSALGGGVGRMREICGAFSACAMLAGLKFSDASADAESKRKIYEFTQKLAEIFKAENGSIICRDILKLQEGAPVSATPQKRDAKYYAERPCLLVIKKASEIIEREIMDAKKIGLP